MSDDLISRQELLESIERISVKGNVLDDDWIYRFIQEFPSAQPERNPGKTLAEEVERIKREITDIFAEQMGVQPSAQPEPSQIARDIANIIENERDMRVIERNAESERKKGKWIYSDDDDPLYDSYFCSCCHRYITVDAERKCDIGFIIDDFDFCPYCGSYNKGDDNVCNKE